MNDRRQTPRISPRRSVEAKVKASVPVRIVDISTGGAQLELATALRPHVPCEIRLLLDGAELILSSTVRRCRAWGFGFDESDRKVLLYRAGIQFEGLPDKVLSRLRATFVELEPPQIEVHAAEADGAVRAEPEEPKEKSKAPRGDGPVKIRISSEHVRRILDKNGK